MSIEAVAWAFKQPVKPAAKKFVLVALADNADTYGICFPSYRHIVQKTALSKSCVRDNIAALVKEGVIEKAPRIRGDGSDTSNAYKLPIIDGCIDDHPLSALFISEGCREEAPPCHETAPPCQQEASGVPGGDTREPSFNRQLIKKEKKTLTRDEFIRQVNKVFHDGEFDAFNLTESEINIQAVACFDAWAGKGEYPTGDAMAAFRGWIRNGIAMKRIKQQPPETACQGERVAKSWPNPEQPWHGKIRDRLGEAVFRSWIRPCWHDGNGQLCAPTKFHADWVNTHYSEEIADVLPNVAIVHQPYQEKEAVHA